jgi:2-oxoglutarate ferredoxin oxidoreductase subunit gamma
MRTEIRISGFGGQGVVLAGYILGKALAIYGDYEAVMTQSYGPEARGGASSANLVVADEPIDYPFIQQPDILVALSQEGYTRFRHTARNGATVLIDGELVMPADNDKPYQIPATRLAEDLGRRVVANVVMLGFFTAVTGLVGREPVEKAITESVKPKTVQLNLQAFHAGYSHAVESNQFRGSP